MSKTNSQERLLTIFLRLQAGKKLIKTRLSKEIVVDPKSIQRDISRLKGILEENPHLGLEIVFDSLDNIYRLIGKTTFNNKDILGISKILLENRSLNKSELNSLLEDPLALLSIEEKKYKPELVDMLFLFFTDRQTIIIRLGPKRSYNLSFY